MVQKKLPLINSAHGSETRNIINELIKLFNQLGYTYDEALQNAHNVLKEAQQTNDMNKDVQRQLDAIILENGNSEAEVVQARIDAEGNEYNVLKERLDAKDHAIHKRLSQITTNANQMGADPELLDNTEILQSALDKRGLVEITKPGTYITGRLLIDDNTHFKLAPGVELKRKSGTNHHLLVNRGHVEGYRNINIGLEGGNYDFNRDENNGERGSMWDDPQSWGHIGIVFKGVKNLTINNIDKVGNEWKYCFLIVDVDGFKSDNITFYNTSDGMHLQPPLKNVEMRNYRGWTGDDMISFTMGDYKRYSLGNYGNVENVLIENIYGELSTEGEPTAELVKIVGSGADQKSEFRNIIIRNLYGEVSVYPVYIMRDDQHDGNTTLVDTKINNVIIENVDVKVQRGYSYVAVGAVSGDITIRKVKMRQKDTSRMIQLVNANLDKVIIEDCHLPYEETATDFDWMIRSQNSDVKQLVIDKCNIDVNSTNNNSLIFSDNDGIRSLSVDNCIIDIGNMNFLYTFGNQDDVKKLKISNSEINSGSFLQTNLKVDVALSSSEIDPITRAFTIQDGGHVSVDASDSLVKNAGINGVNETRSMRVNGKNVKYTSPVSTLTGETGDVVFAAYPTDPIKGLAMYDGQIWRMVNDPISDVYDFSFGTVTANTTKEVSLTPTGYYPLNKEVIATPQFVLPDGIMFTVYNREAGRIRLRLVNVTNNDISIGNTQWMIEVKD